jgi:hypothetical protein
VADAIIQFFLTYYTVHSYMTTNWRAASLQASAGIVEFPIAQGVPIAVETGGVEEGEEDMP